MHFWEYQLELHPNLCCTICTIFLTAMAVARVSRTLPGVWIKLNIFVCSALGLQQQTERKSYVFVCPRRP